MRELTCQQDRLSWSFEYTTTTSDGQSLRSKANRTLWWGRRSITIDTTAGPYTITEEDTWWRYFTMIPLLNGLVSIFCQLPRVHSGVLGWAPIRIVTPFRFLWVQPYCQLTYKGQVYDVFGHSSQLSMNGVMIFTIWQNGYKKGEIHKRSYTEGSGNRYQIYVADDFSSLLSQVLTPVLDILFYTSDWGNGNNYYFSWQYHFYFQGRKRYQKLPITETPS